MKLVTQTQALEDIFGLKGAIKAIKNAGFAGYDCSLHSAMKPGKALALNNYREYAKDVRKYADSIGIECTQAHAMYPPLKTADAIASAIDSHKRAIEIAAILGAEIVVIHPSIILDARGNYERLYSKLLPTAKDFGIKIATENMFRRNPENMAEIMPAACGTPDDFVEYIDTVNDPSFVACLDIGHACLPRTQKAADFIYALGASRLRALHIHSNNGLQDLHTAPFYGKADWNSVCKALSDIGYQGNFTLEADYFLRAYPDELIPPALKLLYGSIKMIAEKTAQFNAEKENK